MKIPKTAADKRRALLNFQGNLARSIRNACSDGVPKPELAKFLEDQLRTLRGR